MNKLTTGEFAVRVLIAIALVALAALLWRVGAILMLIFGGVVLALVLRSVMRLVERFTPVHGRWALLVAILAVIVVLGSLGLLIGSRVAAQVGQLTQTLPRAWQGARAAIDSTPIGKSLLQNLLSQASAQRWTARLAELATISLGALVRVGLIVFTGLYFAADPALYRRGLLSLVPLPARREVQHALDAAGAALGRWLKGVLLAMLSIGVVTGLGLWALGVPLALSLGILGGVCEFIPYVGPIIAAIPAVLMAFTLGPTRALEVVGLYLVVHLFEGELLVPMIQKWTVALPPALGIIAVVMFGEMFGLLGIIFATPLTVVLIALIDTLYVQATLGSPARGR